MASRNPEKPNIVFILTDDQGYWALGCYGNSEIRTPNLDTLATAGTRFENFFCTSPVCSPARASLLTGRIPSQNGVHDWIRMGNMGKDAIEYLEGQIGYSDILARNGYTCGISGKWHLGNSEVPQKSFSHWYVHQRGASPFYNAPMIRDGKAVNDPGYITDLITDDAINFIEEQSERNNPFYISVHYTAPHSPWIDNHPKDIVESYDDCAFDSCPQEPKHPWSPPRLGYIGAPDKWEDMDVRENLKCYYASVTAMDTNIGRIIKRIDEMGLRESTLFCFLSDNGFNCGHHGIWGKGNGTLPINMYDTSVKVPAIMSQPGRIIQNSVCEDLVSGYDFMPTLLDYLDIDNPVGPGLPGKSFAPALYGKPSVKNEGIVVFDEYGPVRMIRTKEWKYVHRYQFGPHELYDLKNDPQERYNLVEYSHNSSVVRELRAQLEEWFCRYVDPAVDGVREPVTGKGQISRVGLKGKGEPAFHRHFTVNMPTVVSVWEPNNRGGE